MQPPAAEDGGGHGLQLVAAQVQLLQMLQSSQFAAAGGDHGVRSDQTVWPYLGTVTLEPGSSLKLTAPDAKLGSEELVKLKRNQKVGWLLEGRCAEGNVEDNEN